MWNKDFKDRSLLDYTSFELGDKFPYYRDQEKTPYPFPKVVPEDVLSQISVSDLHYKMSEHMSEEQRNVVKEHILELFKKKAMDKDIRLYHTSSELPYRLKSVFREKFEKEWDSKTDEEKFSYWKKEYGGFSEGETITVKEGPEKFDPLDIPAVTREVWEEGPKKERYQKIVKDYKATQAVAKYLSIKRAAKIMIERGLATDEKVACKLVADIDEHLWRAWKNSSISTGGLLLQIATAREFGTRLFFRDFDEYGNPEGQEAFLRDVDTPGKEHYFAGIKEIGGIEGVKAYVRAKWETTQFLLDQAHINEVVCYRGLVLHDLKPDEEPKEDVFVEDDVYQRYSHVSIKRNGCVSTSLSRRVANDWSDGDQSVVMRILGSSNSYHECSCLRHQHSLRKRVGSNWQCI